MALENQPKIEFIGALGKIFIIGDGMRDRLDSLGAGLRWLSREPQEPRGAVLTIAPG
jgi:hypothetical protein